MELRQMLEKLHQNRFEHFSIHEADFIEKMHNKVIYARRAPEGTESQTIRRLFQMFVKRSLR